MVKMDDFICFPFFHFSDFFNKKYDKSLIFSKLKKANLIKSVRGAQGGYLLSRKASEITVYDVLTVLEGPVSISDCLLDKDSCENSDSCVTKLVWEKMRDAMDNVMKSITLCDMVNNYNETQIG